MAGDLDDARAAFDRGAWREVFERLNTADDAHALNVDDLERLAIAAVLIGRRADSERAWERAHHEWTHRGELARAARCAFWLAFRMMNSGDVPRGSGWVDRAQRQLDAGELDCVEQGYLRYSRGLHRILESGDAEGALSLFTEAAEIGARFDSIELTTLARVGQGRCVIYLGDIAAGIALLDEAIVSVGGREISPIAVGDVFCTVIDGCHELFDLQRSAAWTAMLDDWCESQPDLVLYRGECLLHRAEVMQLRGRWMDALDEAREVPERLAEPAGPVIHAGAMYLIGETHRALGAFDDAEAAYRDASRLGHDPQPGLALLRLAQDRIRDARATIKRTFEESQDPVTRARMLPAYVEICIAAGDLDDARAGADELQRVADEIGTSYLAASAAYALGTVRFADGDVRGATGSLRVAADCWRDLEVPYEHARTRAALANAYTAIGDADGAQLELDGARATFERLGAGGALARLGSDGQPAQHGPAGLTRRELEVLGHLAKGKTNAGIATELVISERTVESHVRSIFMKINVSTRAAATAYAYETGLV